MTILLCFIILGVFIVQYFNKPKNDVYFSDLNIYVFFAFVLIILFKYISKNPIVLFLVAFIVLLCLYFASFKIKIVNFDIIVKRAFTGSYIINAMEIDRICVSNEFVSDTSQLFLNLHLRNGECKRILISFVSPADFIEKVLQINANIEIDMKKVNKAISGKHLLTFISMLILFSITSYVLLYC